MPTGYTAMLDDNPDMDTKRWIMEGLVRNFGLCYVLRDDPLHLPETVVLKLITKYRQSRIDYHALELGKAVTLSEELKNRTNEEWQRKWKNELARVKKANDKRTDASIIIKTRYLPIKEDLIKIVNTRDADELTKNVARFGIEQLKLVEGDSEPYLEEEPTLNEFKEEQISDNLHNISYHEKELEESKERYKEHISAYKTLKADVERILG